MKKPTISKVGKHVEHSELSATVSGGVKWYNHLRNFLIVSWKSFILWPSNPFLSIYPRKMKIYIHEKPYTSFIHNSQKLCKAQVSIKRMYKQIMLSSYHGILLNGKTGWTTRYTTWINLKNILKETRNKSIHGTDPFTYSSRISKIDL